MDADVSQVVSFFYVSQPKFYVYVVCWYNMCLSSVYHSSVMWVIVHACSSVLFLLC